MEPLSEEDHQPILAAVDDAEEIEANPFEPKTVPETFQEEIKSSEEAEGTVEREVEFTSENIDSLPFLPEEPELGKALSEKSLPEKPVSENYHADFPVGLGLLPEQRKNMVAKRGGLFTLMVVGQKGLGKNTFINTLCSTNIFEINSKHDCKALNDENNMGIKLHDIELHEDNFKLDLTVIEFPGFADHIDNTFSWVPICNFIDTQLRLYLFQEEQPERLKLKDKRVHACLYFLTPSNNGLTPLDITTMKELSKRVNLIPVIPKADGYTKEELAKRKEMIRKLIKTYDISICHYLRDEGSYSSIFEQIPYGVIGADGYYEDSSGNMVKGRKYAWGTLDVENQDHCDFLGLKKLLMSDYMLDLILSTERHYENYRADLLRFRLFQESLLAEGLEFSRPETLIKVDTNGAIIKKFTDVDYFPTADGIKALQKISKVGYEVVEQYVLESDPVFLHKQHLMKKHFAEIVTVQEKKFRDWKRALFEKQNGFNKDIEEIHARVLKHQEAIGYLTAAGSGETYTESEYDDDRNDGDSDESGGDDDEDAESYEDFNRKKRNSQYAHSSNTATSGAETKTSSVTGNSTTSESNSGYVSHTNGGYTTGESKETDTGPGTGTPLSPAPIIGKQSRNLESGEGKHHHKKEKGKHKSYRKW